MGWILGRLLLRCFCCDWKCLRPALLPKPLRDLQRIDFEILPPGNFIAGLMQLPMMTTAKRDGKFVTYFEAQGSGLGKTQMVRIGWLTAADETGLRRNKPQVGLVTKPFGFGNGQNAFINLTREQIR